MKSQENREPGSARPGRNGTRLHIFLGAGGVGKTTLSAALAVHLAFQGRRVGLLSIDPARRLRTALGADRIDESGQIFWPRDTLGGNPSDRADRAQGELRAAVLSLPDSLRRWIRDEGLGGDHEKVLFEHPLFQTVAEKIASATETLAPVRMAEWLEQYPETEDLIIDTAPGLHAVDFLIRPERLLAFFDSKILEWLKWFAGGEKEDSGLVQKLLRTGAKGLLQALGRAGGENILLSLGELLLLMDQVMFRMVDRLEEARRWIRDPGTSIVIVCGLRDDSVSTAAALGRVLKEAGLPEPHTVLNRSISTVFLEEAALTWPGIRATANPESKTAGERSASTGIENEGAIKDDPPVRREFADFDELFLAYLRSCSGIRESVLQRLGGIDVTELPVFAGLEKKGDLRLDELARLGAALIARQGNP